MSNENEAIWRDGSAIRSYRHRCLMAGVPPLASVQPAQRLSKLSGFQGAYLARSCRSSTDRRRRQRQLVSYVGLTICSEGKGCKGCLAAMSPDPFSTTVSLFCDLWLALPGAFLVPYPLRRESAKFHLKVRVIRSRVFKASTYSTGLF